jgi:hypothetical protein
LQHERRLVRSTVLPAPGGALGIQCKHVWHETNPSICCLPVLRSRCLRRGAGPSFSFPKSVCQMGTWPVA